MNSKSHELTKNAFKIIYDIQEELYESVLEDSDILSQSIYFLHCKPADAAGKLERRALNKNGSVAQAPGLRWASVADAGPT